MTEILRARVHRGLPAGMFFLRDSRGADVNLLVEAGARLIAVEAKSGQTVASDFLAAFCRLADTLENAALGRSQENVLVFGGDVGQRCSDATIVPWSLIHSYPWQ